MVRNVRNLESGIRNNGVSPGSAWTNDMSDRWETGQSGSEDLSWLREKTRSLLLLSVMQTKYAQQKIKNYLLRGQTDRRPGDCSQITKEMLIQSFKYSLLFHRDRHMQINGRGEKKYNSTLLIKAFKKVSLKINVVHNGCYFKLQEITFITLNNNCGETQHQNMSPNLKISLSFWNFWIIWQELRCSEPAIWKFRSNLITKLLHQLKPIFRGIKENSARHSINDKGSQKNMGLRAVWF